MIFVVVEANESSTVTSLQSFPLNGSPLGLNLVEEGKRQCR